MNYSNVHLYSKNKSGKTLSWKAYIEPVEDPSGFIHLFIEFGQLDGKIQIKERIIKSGKNKGKINETTTLQQAYLELGYLCQKQLDQGYVFNIEDYREPIRPQLAFKYKDKAHTVDWIKTLDNDPQNKLYGSRKLNGIRCAIFLKDGKFTFESRTGKLFKYFEHIAKDIDIPSNDQHYMFDGELFNKDIPFEVLCSLVNSDEYTEVEYDGIIYNTNQVEFHCYDFVDFANKEDSYYDRFIDNFSLFYYGDNFKVVSNRIINNEEHMISVTKEWVEEGFEGLMLRSGWTSYQFGIRTIFLLKVKFFESDEFKIKDIYLAENNNTKTMFILYNHNSTIEPYNVFDCSIKGNKEFNLQYFLNKKQYINKWCTVSYQVLSSYNVPLFAQIENIREGIEINGIYNPNV